MRFGPVPISLAEGAVLAHATRAGGRRFTKGQILAADTLATFRAAGIAEIIVARLDADDIPENTAAVRAATPLLGAGIEMTAPFTGRVNLHATAAGLLLADRASITRLNLVDEAITIASLAPDARVRPGKMVATIKIIPFAVKEARLSLWEQAATPLSVAPFRPLKVALIQTALADTKRTVLDRSEEVIADRLAAVESCLLDRRRCGHDEVAIAAALAGQLSANFDLLLVLGASAIIDRNDVVPSAIRRLGGIVEHFGMPVDPGNLLLLGRVGEIPILGLPGCARSPKLNGVDRVLQRIAAGLPVTRHEIAAMGSGGLLSDTVERGGPREAREIRHHTEPTA